MAQRILLVEDDVDFGNMLRQYLEICSYEVARAMNGKEALEILEKEKFDMCILDVMMPEMDGFSLAEIVRKDFPGLPFLFLTARVMKEDRIKGLKIGADDYITKPFEADELVLRIQNILRRSKKETTPIEQPTTQQIGIYTFYKDRFELVSSKNTYRLTERESELLGFLILHKNKVVKRDDILNTLWKESDFFTGRSMDVFISRLRKYLKEDNNISIESIRGVGFILKES